MHIDTGRNWKKNTWYYLEPDENSDTDYHWDEEDLKLLNDHINSERRAEALYGEYIDNEPCFPRVDQNPDCDLPGYMSLWIGYPFKVNC